MKRFLFLFLLIWIPAVCLAQTTSYRDVQHASAVFGKAKTFRLYLPDDYDRSGQRYPVIYFFHGWGGRWYKDDSAKLEYEKLGEPVNKHRVILVMWDGSMDEAEPRPYNTGNHEDVKFRVQMKDYFPELVHYVDSAYRTLPDREHRGIIGFSMGGFMAAYLAGKYPDKVSAITDMVGSPEFFVGDPDNHTLYPVRYTLDNLRDVAFRLHNMDNCPLFYMNTEVKNAAAWEELPHFDYRLGEGDHKVDDPGETKVFEAAMQFITDRFNHPSRPDPSWSHYDLYPDFDVWDYSVKSDKREPGFLFLRKVSPAGFGLYTCKWLPDGPPIRNCRATVTTAPVYQKGLTYHITVYDGQGNAVRTERTADADGRLHIELTGDGCEVSIMHRSQPADWVATGYRLTHPGKWIRVGEDNEWTLTLLNRGGAACAGKKIRLAVHCTDTAVVLSDTVQELWTDRTARTLQSRPIRLICRKMPPGDASPPQLKLHVEIRCGEEVFRDAVTVPVFYDVPYFRHIRIDDGQAVRDKAIGSGNGDGQADAAEQLLLYENYQRLRLYTDDPYVENDAGKLYDEMIPSGIWPDGFTLSSIVKIADGCPPGHTIEFLASYETKTFMPIRREVHWGRVRLTIGQKD
jgi:pimeloyl-ACP methyl ester carboxylesterase